MTNYQLRIQARILRKNGISMKQITKKLEISKNTASLWVRDTVLTIEQLEALRQSELRGAGRGRLQSALLQKKRRLQKES